MFDKFSKGFESIIHCIHRVVYFTIKHYLVLAKRSTLCKGSGNLSCQERSGYKIFRSLLGKLLG